MFKYCFSVVSHNNASLVESLLNEFDKLDDISFQIILTINIPESLCLDIYKFKLIIINNKKPLGYGSNHNNAFRHSNSQYFIVCNPDISLKNFDIEPLTRIFLYNKVGACGPLVITPTLKIEDSARKFPTICNLFKRKFFTTKIDYQIENKPLEVDWIAGMFMMFKSDLFKTISGFNESYHMYCEDADICKRIKASGHSVFLVPSTSVIHDARRSSRRNIRYLYWHIKSMVYFLFINSKS